MSELFKDLNLPFPYHMVVVDDRIFITQPSEQGFRLGESMTLLKHTSIVWGTMAGNGVEIEKPISYGGSVGNDEFVRIVHKVINGE